MKERAYHCSDLGVGPQLAHRMATDLVDTSRDLPRKDRGRKRPSYVDWSSSDAYEYGAWIEAVIKTGYPNKQITKTEIDRAAILQLGPSRTTLCKIAEVETLADYQHNLHGLTASFEGWSKDDYIQEGVQLAKQLDRRPTTRDLAGWHQDEIYPSVARILHRFGGLNNWFEHIGYPSPKGWEECDYIDWCVALYKAHPDILVTDKVLDYFSKKGRGPSAWTVNNVVGGIPKLRQLSRQRIEAEQTELESQKETLMTRLQTDNRGQQLLEGCRDISECVYGRYVLLQRFCSERRSEDNMSSARLPLHALLSVFKKYSVYSLAEIEAWAFDEGFFDIVFPTHRFGNVDFTIDDHVAQYIHEGFPKGYQSRISP